MQILRFDNRFARELPGDPKRENRRRQVNGALWSPVAPTPVADPRLLAISPECAALLDLEVGTLTSKSFVDALAGNALLPGMQPIATNYGGHQFGHWAGQLGDGRAISLGETVNARGERWELQLKGAGPTPYSRGADGRAVLRSSLREFICSEAMHHLGVPTTRALALVGTGEAVTRDMFYDGRPRDEPGAIVCRVAPSFIRLGHFELPAARGDIALLERLVEFTIARDFPDVAEAHRDDAAARRRAWFTVVCERTARLIAEWTRVGFVHGVMNTDNLSVLGLTIDYGPYGWLDAFDPDFTPNTTDAEGKRYRFAHQSAVAEWNLSRFAGALVPLFGDTAALEAGLARYREVFGSTHRALTAAKFGFARWQHDDAALVRDAFALLAAAEVDHTLFFRRLARVAPAQPDYARLAEAFYGEALRLEHADAFSAWLTRWAARVASDGVDDTTRRAAMDHANPCYVPRNWLAQEAIDAAESGDLAPLEALFDVVRGPYVERPGLERYAGLRPDWARNRAGCSMLSCSS